MPESTIRADLEFTWDGKAVVYRDRRSRRRVEIGRLSRAELRIMLAISDFIARTPFRWFTFHGAVAALSGGKLALA
jgi:hypothetical protein